MTVGDRIRERRIELGLTQEELATRMGYSGKSSVCAAETGGDNVTTTKVKKFAMALGCSPRYLMGFAEEEGYINVIPAENIEFSKPYKEKKKAEELYSLYENSSPEVQKAVELLLRSAQQTP